MESIPKNISFARLDGGLNYEMAISDWKYAADRFDGCLVGSFREQTYSETLCPETRSIVMWTRTEELVGPRLEHHVCEAKLPAVVWLRERSTASAKSCLVE